MKESFENIGRSLPSRKEFETFTEDYVSYTVSDGYTAYWIIEEKTPVGIPSDNTLAVNKAANLLGTFEPMSMDAAEELMGTDN